MTPIFAVPSLEGARLALEELAITSVTTHCAVAIDVFNAEGILIQRSLAHADVPRELRDAFRELVDRTITRFADAQDLERARTVLTGSAYRESAVASNEFAGFDVGYASAVAHRRVDVLKKSLRLDALDLRLYAVPFLGARAGSKQYAVMRTSDGTYVAEELPSD